MRPSVEALEEFRVEAAYYDADLGTQSGAQIISAIRPGLTIGTGTFGQVTSAGMGRVMQFGLRYEF